VIVKTSQQGFLFRSLYKTPFTTRKVTSTNSKITVFMMKWKESGRLLWLEGTSLYHSFL